MGTIFHYHLTNITFVFAVFVILAASTDASLAINSDSSLKTSLHWRVTQPHNVLPDNCAMQTHLGCKAERPTKVN